MSDYAHQHYQAHYKLHQESEGKPERHYVRVSFRPRAIKTGTDELSNTYVEKYKTLHYDHPQEAFAHAYGWVDCELCDQTALVEEEDFRKKACYSKAREEQDRLSIPEVTEKELTETRKKEKEEWEKTLEKRYSEGWEAYKKGREKKSTDGGVDD
jgi:hypothetical protein